MEMPSRAVAILFVVIGIFSLVAVTLYYGVVMQRVYATGGSGNVSNVPNMFSSKNIECALHSNYCDILRDKS